ncbi:hypothetical protein [Aurantiacibacter gilvus]|uniref:Uncharacterized protein n=1 Tax=Aurantiacibacter gilvus TaxID=3139141 RepID=A0ABU9IEE7_9SPHN
MPERQKTHSDKDLIDRMRDEETPSQQDRSGGEVNTRVGSRDELKRATTPDNREPVVGSDNPAEDAKKGPKTRAEIQRERNKS